MSLIQRLFNSLSPVLESRVLDIPLRHFFLPTAETRMPQSRHFALLNATRLCLFRMGKAGRRKRSALEYELFDGAGCSRSSGLQLELAPNNESGYAGVSGPTTSSRWQAFVRVEREGHKVRRNVGSFDTAQEAAVQRALALLGSVEVLSPSSRGPRSTGMLPVTTHCCLTFCLVLSRVLPCLTGAKSEVSSAALGELSINLFGNVMPLSAPARAAVASDEAACSDRQCCGCGRPRTAARCLCELHRAHEGLGHGGLQHVVPC